jgi:hypothetical protein
LTTECGLNSINSITQSQNASCAICQKEDFWQLHIKLLRFVMKNIISEREREREEENKSKVAFSAN